MNDEQIRKVYTTGNNESHTVGLRAVYDAGRNHDAWVKEQERAPSAATGTVEHEPFDEMTNAELRAYLDARGVANDSSANKADLERMARAAERKEKAPA